MAPEIDQPAFPVSKHRTGLTLRDYFAAAAIPTAYAQVSKEPLQSGWGTVSQIAYVIADHMLKERAK